LSNTIDMRSERYDNCLKSIDFSNYQLEMLDCARFLQVITTTINLQKIYTFKTKTEGD